jgi:hypothetical protein
MQAEYKVISDWLCLTVAQKARKIENHLNNLSAEGWEFVALDPMTVLGCDIGFYLVLRRGSLTLLRIRFSRPHSIASRVRCWRPRRK